MTIKLPTQFSILSLIFCLVGICWLPAVFADESAGLVPEDYFDFVFVTDPQVSPDNKQILFVQSIVKDDASGRERQIFKIAEDGKVTEFTQGTSDRSARWSPNGERVAFLRSTESKTQVFVMPANGGESKQLTSVEEGVSAFSWFPDNQKLLLTINTPPPGEADEQDGEDKGSENSRVKPDIVDVKNAKYIANGSKYLNNKRKHLYLFDIASKALTQLTIGDNWNANAPQISADGKYVYFHANKTGKEYEGNRNNDIFRINLESKEIAALTKHPHAQFNASLSADGSRMVFLNTEDTYEQTDLLLMSTNGSGSSKNLTAKFDRDASKALWSPDNKTLYFTANDHGANRLFSVNIDDANVTTLLESEASIRHLNISPDGESLVFSRDSSTELPEIYRLEIKSKQLTQLTTFNDALLAKRKLSPAKNFWFENEKGMKVQGFVHYPLDFDKDKRYPVVLNIKGGPGGMWGHRWFHENQMYVAEGYAVVYVNYRGSSGYGLAHSQAVRLDYGGADYRDNVQFLDAVLAEFKWMDEDRLYITGGSHGGFLTNWITTQTDRFKAAVTQRSVSNWVSEAGTQQFTPLQMTQEFGGNLWQNFDYYWDRSPLKYADKVKTPTLIIHSDADMITPIGQGQEWFYALKANDIPVEMVIFKGETHSLSRTGKPINLVERLKRILAWFEKY